MSQFSNYSLAPFLLDALKKHKITQPTPIQEQCLPLLLESKQDFMGIAPTGTGKTLAYVLPLLQNIDPHKSETQALILLPTRELCQQIADQVTQFASSVPEIKVLCLSGGTAVKPQIKALQQGVQILVATPGRLIDLLAQEVVQLGSLRYLILDEADEMLGLSFKATLDEIVQQTSSKHQTWLFSATYSAELQKICKEYLKAPLLEVKIEESAQDAKGRSDQYVVVDPIEKFEVLAHFLNTQEGKKGIIFCRTKTAVQKLYKQLATQKFAAGALHGDLPQGLRDRMMDQFRASQISILVASDVASRGIDLPGLSFVVHYHLADTAETYTHRSGRTARAGLTGMALTFIFSEELPQLKELEKELKFKIKPIQKAENESIEEDKAYLWAKRILHTKPNYEGRDTLGVKIRSVFQHLSKDELIDRLIAAQLQSNKPLIDPRLGKKDLKFNSKLRPKKMG